MYMNNKYYSLKEQLQNIKNRCSKTYENSLLYQKEILDFKGIANLQEQYQFINQEISNIRLNFQENNYSHLFSSLNEIYNNFMFYFYGQNISENLGFIFNILLCENNEELKKILVFSSQKKKKNH